MPNRAHAAAVGHEVRLGKLEVKHDARNLQLARYVDTETLLPDVPSNASWSQKVKRWPMYANDRLSDCTCAAVAHMEEGWSANAGKVEVPNEQSVLDLYWATGKTDTGRYCLDVLNYWQTHGFGGELARPSCRSTRSSAASSSSRAGCSAASTSDSHCRGAPSNRRINGR